MIHLIPVPKPEFRRIQAAQSTAEPYDLRIDGDARFQTTDVCVLAEVCGRCRQMTGRYAVRKIGATAVWPGGAGILRLFYMVNLALLVLLVLSGCAGGRALRPGRAAASLGASAALPTTAEMVQPENPAQSSTQNLERVKETELQLPAATRITETRISAAPGENAVTNTRIIELSAPTVERSKTVERAGASIGAAQKDTARELGAKLAALRPAVWVGLLMVLIGIAIAAYPPLRVAVGSMTTALWCIAGGIALIALPSLIAGNEVLILGLVLGGVLLWWLAHRHGALKAQASNVAQVSKPAVSQAAEPASAPHS